MHWLPGTVLNYSVIIEIYIDDPSKSDKQPITVNCRKHWAPDIY